MHWLNTQASVTEQPAQARSTVPSPNRRRWYRGAATAVISAALNLTLAGQSHAQAQPIDLRVDDRPAPLAVQDVPTFGWQTRGTVFSGEQAAYQIQVFSHDNTLVWDTGRVESSSQEYIPYGGPDLSPGQLHRWRVRTWTHRRSVSRWSAFSTFETGLMDADWGGATWIQRAPGSTGPLERVGGGVRVSGGGVTLAALGTGWSDYQVEFNVQVGTTAAGWMVRSPNSNNGYMFQLAEGTGLKPHILINGRYTKLEPVELEVDRNTEYQIRVELEGTTIRTYVAGQLLHTLEDATFSAGTIGFREANGEVGLFSDLHVSDLAGATLLADDFSGSFTQWDVEREREDDEWTFARREIELAGKPVRRARLWASGSHTYQLRIAGKVVDRGPAFTHPDEGYYQVTDVTEALQNHGGGPVTLAAVLHWYGAGQGRPKAEPGLLTRLKIEYTDGSEQVFTTDGNWKVAAGPYRTGSLRNYEGDFVEILDGQALASLAGWDQTGFDDSGWDNAVVLGAHPTDPFTNLQAQETSIAESIITPVALLTADDGTVVADFGKVVPARPFVHFDEGVAGREIPIRTSYLLDSTGRVSQSSTGTQSTNMSFPYVQSDGEQTYQAFTHLAFRYLEVPDANEDIVLDDIGAVLVHTTVPEGKEATFESSDTTLNAVWNLMQRSALYSIQQRFVDTPTREKGQFLWDAVNISYATMQGFCERDSTQQAILEFLASQRRYWTSGSEAGRYNAVYPNGDGQRDIPDFTQIFANWVYRYYEVTGDRQLLASAYPAVSATADYVLRHIPVSGATAGLVTNLTGGKGPYQYGIVDWPAVGRFDYDMNSAARTTINALGVEVLQRTADMAVILGKPGTEVDYYQDAADALRIQMNALLRDDEGLYVDGLAADGTPSSHRGQHATSYAMAFGVAPEADLPMLADYIAGLGMRQGPMTAHWLLKALDVADRPADVLSLLTNHDDLGWASVLDQGGTFTWEAWDASYSHSHGWGAQAAVDIIETLLGIRLGATGPGDIAIKPPSEGLEYARGTVHTQRGPVTLDWKRTEGGLRATLKVPGNVRAQVSLPRVEGYRYRALGGGGGGGGGHGSRHGGGATKVGETADRLLFEVGSGTTVFVPTRAR